MNPNKTAIIFNNDERKNNFNILRFIAAVMVIYGHMFPLLGLHQNLLLNQNVSTIAVKIFMLISGYLVTQSYLREKQFLYYVIKRVFRIFPALIFCIVITVFVIGPMFTAVPVSEYFSNSQTYFYLYKNILLSPVYSLTGVFGDNIYPNAVNGSLWTLPIEFALYFIFPFIVYVFSRMKGKKIIYYCVTIGVCVLSIILLKYFPGKVIVIYGTNIIEAVYIGVYFFIGGLFSLIDLKKYLNIQIASIAFFVAVCLGNFGNIKMEILTLILLPYFVFSFAFAEKAFFSKCFSKNDYSYGIYLWGFVIQQIFTHLLVKYEVRFNYYLLFSILGALICAIVSWHFIERPAQDMGRKLIKTIKTRRGRE
ncbi:acyltransferase family protein [Parasporobacterium paucivorans]|uniref:Peptidoglycan/LPS O-acetylase OafA/YrhL, contains acyltransferase and SGNH-hydrolase domains n=1 Tax=Parasporobacterium paucivorans DSM 15970 TaxID=1122934 RepID=A0A1M6H5H5_9FIRM|nr:acyltransferase [Parasporobacterium paucivorans]SHJ17450.1 Peptidoglycan/LPS O-acetylase OafA/YrhL, contains acyltransferase and SGNH-hydrolase domains [Parasporobacterium paucivorans DSM 15970]